MKKTLNVILTMVLAGLVFAGTLCYLHSLPRAKHVILLGFDAMSSAGIRKAETPNFDRMIENGALSLHTRCIRPTSSSQNWMSMVSAAPSEMHGVLTNRWNRGEGQGIEPAIVNAEGNFPTIFDHIRAQKPKLKQYAFIEWTGEVRMYDTLAFDVFKAKGYAPEIADYHDVINMAFDTYLKDRPELMFLSMDINDAIGHHFGHDSQEYFDSITEMDALVGKFVHELESRGWMKNTVIIITADHGGTGFGHGGDTMAELEIPVIMYGKGVTRGKVMKGVNMIYDVGATVAGLLGVELPWECRGKFLSEAFEPVDR